MFLSSYCTLKSHFKQLGKERISLNCVVKVTVFEENFVFCVFGRKEKAFKCFPFTGIFLLLNADKIPSFFFHISVEVSKT